MGIEPAFINTIMLMAQEMVGVFFFSLDSLKSLIKCPNTSDQGLFRFFSGIFCFFIIIHKQLIQAHQGLYESNAILWF